MLHTRDAHARFPCGVHRAFRRRSIASAESEDGHRDLRPPTQPPTHQHPPTPTNTHQPPMCVSVNQTMVPRGLEPRNLLLPGLARGARVQIGGAGEGPPGAATKLHHNRFRASFFALCDELLLVSHCTHSVVASYKPSMLVTGVRFPVCASLLMGAVTWP